MKIFIDFDNVMFDTEKFKSDLAKIFLKNGISKKEFADSYLSFKTARKAYEPREHIKILTGGDDDKARRLFLYFKNLMKNLEKYVFQDAIEFLKSHSKKILYLISYGNKKFQKEKINKSGIAPYFKNIIITRGNKAKEIRKIIKSDKFKKNETVIFIDDKPKHIKEIKELDNIKIFQMCRQKSIILCKEADYCVKNFKEVVKLLSGEILPF